MYFAKLQELNEMSTVSRIRGMCITVNPDKRRVGDEYFKLYNANSVSKADKMIRILFKMPEYVFHRTKGFTDWILTSTEKRDLMDFLNSKERYPDADEVFHSITVFQKALILFNYERGLGSSPFETFSLMLKGDNENFLPLELEIPDYTKL